MTVAEVLELLAKRSPNEEVFVHATAEDGSVAVCDVTGHTTLGRDEGIVLLAECSAETRDLSPGAP